MAITAEMDSVQVLEIDQFINGKDLVVCERYHARLSKEACRTYRAHHADACRGCKTGHRRRVQAVWTRERMLQVLLDYAQNKDYPITVEEFKDEFGLNFNVIKREWGSWRALCAAAGLPTGRRGRSNGRGASAARPQRRQIKLDLRGLPDLYDALHDEAQENERDMETQIISILKGWFA